MEGYIELITMDEPRFGEITIFMNQMDQSDKIMRTTRVSKTQEEFKASTEQVVERCKTDSPNLLRLLEVKTEPEALRTHAFFEYPEGTIELESMKHSDAVKCFVDILQAICYLQTHKMIHGDIRPDYISYVEKDKRYKLIDRLVDLSPPLQCQLNNITKLRTLFMSPVIFDELSKKAKKIKQNSYKSELFSLGMIILGCFKHPDVIQEFYNVDDGVFEKEEFAEFVEELAEKNKEEPAHSFLKFMAEHVLEVDEKKRATPTRALDMLREIPALKSYVSDDGSENAEEPQNTTETTEATIKYYNPFDFLKPSNEGSQMLSSFTKDPLPPDKKQTFQMMDGSAIDPIAKSKNLVVSFPKEQLPSESVLVEQTTDVSSSKQTENATLHTSPEQVAHEQRQEVASPSKSEGQEKKETPRKETTPQSQSHPESEKKQKMSEKKESVAEQQPASLEAMKMVSSEVIEQEGQATTQEAGNYFKELGIEMDEEEKEEKRLEDKIRESEHLSIYREDLLYSNRNKVQTKFNNLSELIKNRNTFERGNSSRSPKRNESKKEEAVAVKEDNASVTSKSSKFRKSISGAYNFINPKSSQVVDNPKPVPVEEPKPEPIQKKFQATIQDIKKIASQGATLKRSGTASNLHASDTESKQSANEEAGFAQRSKSVRRMDGQFVTAEQLKSPLPGPIATDSQKPAEPAQAESLIVKEHPPLHQSSVMNHHLKPQQEETFAENQAVTTLKTNNIKQPARTQEPQMRQSKSVNELKESQPFNGQVEIHEIEAFNQAKFAKRSVDNHVTSSTSSSAFQQYASTAGINPLLSYEQHPQQAPSTLSYVAPTVKPIQPTVDRFLMTQPSNQNDMRSGNNVPKGYLNRASASALTGMDRPNAAPSSSYYTFQTMANTPNFSTLEQNVMHSDASKKLNYQTRPSAPIQSFAINTGQSASAFQESESQYRVPTRVSIPLEELNKNEFKTQTTKRINLSTNPTDSVTQILHKLEREPGNTMPSFQQPSSSFLQSEFVFNEAKKPSTSSFNELHQRKKTVGAQLSSDSQRVARPSSQNIEYTRIESHQPSYMGMQTYSSQEDHQVRFNNNPMYIPSNVYNHETLYSTQPVRTYTTTTTPYTHGIQHTFGSIRDSPMYTTTPYISSHQSEKIIPSNRGGVTYKTVSSTYNPNPSTWVDVFPPSRRYL